MKTYEEVDVSSMHSYLWNFMKMGGYHIPWKTAPETQWTRAVSDKVENTTVPGHVSQILTVYTGPLAKYLSE
jgi:hypothetical protein